MISRSSICAMLSLRGLTAAVFTPMTKKGIINPDRIPNYAQYLAEHQVSNIFVTGTSGEFPSLTLNERLIIQKKWIKQGKKYLSGKVIVHIGSTALPDAQELARHAGEQGTDAIASVAPYFVVPATVDVMIEYFKELTKVVPNTPFLYYHFPSMTGCKVDLCDFISAALKEIPTFVGLKYTDSDMEQLRNLRERVGDDVLILNGFDYLNSEAMKLGVLRGISATNNFMPGPHIRMREAFDKNETEAFQEEANFISEVFRIMEKHSRFGLSSGLKDMARVAGLDVGSSRLPLKDCNDDTEDYIRADLEKIDFFNKRY